MQNVFRLAHVSDVHLPNVTGFWPRHWNLKRGLGFINWQRKRRFVHLRETVDLLVRDLKEQACDHIAVSGDLANLGLPSELAAARIWLNQLGSADEVSVVPGNHDIYCALWTDAGTRRWADYMRGAQVGGTGGDSPVGGGDNDPTAFPYVRRFGRIALIGVNSAVPTAPGIACGQVGRAQLDRLRRVLVDLASEDLCRIVMIHHPPLPGQASARRCLRDAGALEQVLQDAGAELVIHGHNHRDMLAECAGKDGVFPIVGVPSLSSTPGPKSAELAAYNIYEISQSSSGHAIVLKQRGIKRDQDGVFALKEQVISGSMDKQS